MISFIVPTYNEQNYLKSCLDSIKSQDIEKEIIIVDGGSRDETLSIAELEADKIIKNINGRGKARDKGADKAEGDYLAFIDADTCLKDNYAYEMRNFLEENDLSACSSYYRMTGYRSKIVQIFGNILFKRRSPVLLPGFNSFVRAEDYEKSKGFEDIMGEDLQFSDEIASQGDTDILEKYLVVNSGRRMRRMGLTGTLLYYGAKEIYRREQNFKRNTGSVKEFI